VSARSVILVVVPLLLVGAGPVRAQRGDSLPSVIATAFHQAYPEAKILNVSRERRDGKVVYEIESQDGSTRRDLIYGLDGQAIEIEEIIPADSVPEAVRAAIARDVPNAQVIGAERIMRGEVVLYEVQVRRNGSTQYLTYDPKGERRE
jgi:Putative beta-lactamase-inhibitor-like, PepSY-like